MFQHPSNPPMSLPSQTEGQVLRRHGSGWLAWVEALSSHVACPALRNPSPLRGRGLRRQRRTRGTLTWGVGLETKKRGGRGIKFHVGQHAVRRDNLADARQPPPFDWQAKKLIRTRRSGASPWCIWVMSDKV